MKLLFKQHLFELQAGVCWICLKPLDLSISSPKHPLFVTADHLVPRARGGRGPGNKLLAHRRCNSQRGCGQPISLRSALALLEAKIEVTYAD